MTVEVVWGGVKPRGKYILERSTIKSLSTLANIVLTAPTAALLNGLRCPMEPLIYPYVGVVSANVV